jgi:hypothetical protein
MPWLAVVLLMDQRSKPWQIGRTVSTSQCHPDHLNGLLPLVAIHGTCCEFFLGLFDLLPKIPSMLHPQVTHAAPVCISQSLPCDDVSEML